MKNLSIDTETMVETIEKNLTKKEGTRAIVMYNDNVNTFDHVISCLVDYCKHTETQAEQCALFVHHHGKYAVKGGSFDDLKPIAEALLENGLTVEIE